MVADVRYHSAVCVGVVYEEYADQRLSFTDARTVALVDYHDIGGVSSFDDDLKSVTERVAPTAVAD